MADDRRVQTDLIVTKRLKSKQAKLMNAHLHTTSGRWEKKQQAKQVRDGVRSFQLLEAYDDFDTIAFLEGVTDLLADPDALPTTWAR